LGRHRARDEESEAARVAMLFDAFWSRQTKRKRCSYKLYGSGVVWC
jgi:hypothetical protein